MVPQVDTPLANTTMNKVTAPWRVGIEGAHVITLPALEKGEGAQRIKRPLKVTHRAGGGV